MSRHHVNTQGFALIASVPRPSNPLAVLVSFEIKYIEIPSCMPFDDMDAWLKENYRIDEYQMQFLDPTKTSLVFGSRVFHYCTITFTNEENLNLFKLKYGGAHPVEI